MNFVTRSALRITMYNIILDAITVSPESKRNEFENKYDPVITKREIINFIDTNPYFSEMLKAFLKSKFIEDIDAIMVSEEWKSEFVKLVKQWAESFI